MELQNELMAIRILHGSIIRFVVIHDQKYEGYANWWNGGILQEMFTLDNRYGKNIFLQVAYENMLDNDLLRIQQLRRFQKKKTKLAWALLHIMDEMYKSNNLHNDISLDNVFFHFPTEESQVLGYVTRAW